MKRAPVKSTYFVHYKVGMPIFAWDFIEDSRQAGLAEELWSGIANTGPNCVRLTIDALNNVIRRLTTCK